MSISCCPTVPLLPLLLRPFLSENRVGSSSVCFATVAVASIALCSSYLAAVRVARSRQVAALLTDLGLAHAVHVDCVHRDLAFLSRAAVENGLLKTFAIPSISALLASTREFSDRTERRSVDVDLLVGEFVEHRPDSRRGKLAIRRMNAVHARYKTRIPNEDYLYVLSIFMCQALLCIDLYGYRPVHRNEEIASYVVWKYIGEQMGIRNIPPSYRSMRTYLYAYEERKMKFAKSNVDLLRPVLEFNLRPVPRFLRPLMTYFLAATCDGRMRKALDLADPPPAYATGLLRGFLALLAFAERHLLLPRRRRLMMTPPDGDLPDTARVCPAFHCLPSRLYMKDGYRVGELGPPSLLSDDEFGELRRSRLCR